ANARVVHATKGQVAMGVVHDAMVQGHAARTGVVQDVASAPLVLAPDVQGERLGTGIDVSDDLVQVGVAQDGQHRAEDLLAHDGGRRRQLIHQGGCDETPGDVHLTTGEHTCPLVASVL